MTSSVIPLPIALLNLKSAKRTGKKYKNLNIANEKSFLDEIKKNSYFLKAYHLMKKKLIKNSGHKL